MFVRFLILYLLSKSNTTTTTANPCIFFHSDLNKVLQTTFLMFKIDGRVTEDGKESEEANDIYISFLHKLFLDQDDDVIRYLSLLFDLNQGTSL